MGDIYYLMNLMRKLYNILLLASIVLLASPAVAQESDFSQNSLVIVKVPGLTGEQYYQISETLATDRRYSLEYSCLESGVVVLRYYHNFSEEGDVRTAIKAMLRRQAPIERLEVIYVDISSESDTRC